MGEMKVEHVLLFLVGAFLVYHMMKGCGCNKIEGMIDWGGLNLPGLGPHWPPDSPPPRRRDCRDNYAAFCPDYDPDICKWDNKDKGWSVALSSASGVKGEQDMYYYYPDQKTCIARYAWGPVDFGYDD